MVNKMPRDSKRNHRKKIERTCGSFCITQLCCRTRQGERVKIQFVYSNTVICLSLRHGGICMFGCIRTEHSVLEDGISSGCKKTKKQQLQSLEGTIKCLQSTCAQHLTGTYLMVCWPSTTLGQTEICQQY